jgi:putative copper resistance protein D
MIDWAWLVLRAAGLMLTFQAVGAGLFGAAFAPRLARSAPAIRRVAVRVSLATLALLAAQALYEPVHLAGDFSGLFDAQLLRLFLGSSTATALAVRFTGVAGGALGWVYGAPRVKGLAVVGALMAVSSFLLTGHIAVHRERLLLAPLLLVHLGIVTFWFGSLWPLRQLTALEAPADAARLLAAFSSVAVWLVPLIALAGIGMAALLLPDFAALGQPYGLALLGKLTLFALLMGVAALNRLRLTPSLARGERAAASRLRGSIALEYVLIGAVFALTAVMTGNLSP